MQKPEVTAEKLPLESLAPNLERFEKLQELYPDAFVEGKLDADKLRQILGEDVDLGPERYGLSWRLKKPTASKLSAINRFLWTALPVITACRSPNQFPTDWRCCQQRGFQSSILIFRFGRS